MTDMNSWEREGHPVPVIEDKTRSRRRDPGTSKEAAERVREFDTGHYAKILQCLQQAHITGAGMGAEMISKMIFIPAYAIRKRLPELEAAGLVAVAYDSENERAITSKTSSGRRERTWQIVPEAARKALESAAEKNPSKLPDSLGKTVTGALKAALEARGLRTDGDTLALARRCHLMALKDRDLIALQKTIIEKTKEKANGKS